MKISGLRLAHTIALALLSALGWLGGCNGVTPPALQVTVTAVSPANDLLGGGSSLTITGTNFISVTSVTIGGNELGGRTVLSPTQITGTTPAATSPEVTDVVVTSSSHGSGSCRGCFSYESLVLQTQPLAAGDYHTCALNSSGAAYCWGHIDPFTDIITVTAIPEAVSGGWSFSAIVASGFHTCALASSGAAYCWGANHTGQLGNGSTTSSAAPVAVSGGLSFSALATGGTLFPTHGPAAFYTLAHTCGLTRAGAAYCWGDNSYGQLGAGSPTRSATPVAVSGGLSFRALAAGTAYTCALTSTGAAYCWGAGYGTAPVAVSGGLSFSALAAGTSHTCGLTGSGVAYCWGYNGDGQLGDGSTMSSALPVAVSGGLNFSALAAGGGRNGRGHTCGITSAGAASCWGDNSSGQLGDGSTTNRSTPVAVSGGLTFTAVVAGGAHTCGLTSAGARYCWGNNHAGQQPRRPARRRLTTDLVGSGARFQPRGRHPSRGRV